MYETSMKHQCNRCQAFLQYELRHPHPATDAEERPFFVVCEHCFGNNPEPLQPAETIRDGAEDWNERVLPSIMRLRQMMRGEE